MNFRILRFFVAVIITSVGSKLFAQDISLMTYNIRLDIASDSENAWPLRKNFLVSQLKFYEPDIFGIQEGLPNQVQYIDEQLDHYTHVGAGREGEGKGEFSAIYFKTKKFTVKKTNTFWLSNTPDHVSKGWDASYLRVCTYALFTDNKTKADFWVFNTHLDNDGAEARKKGVELILQKMNELNGANLPVFFMGDFNSTPDTELILDLSKVLVDTRTMTEAPPFGPAGTFNGFEYSKPVSSLIDYIFVSKKTGVVVKKYGVLTDSNNLKYPSDHFPVFVEIKIDMKEKKGAE